MRWGSRIINHLSCKAISVHVCIYVWLFHVEPCADVIVSAAASQSILVGGGCAPGPKKSALAAKKCFFKDSQKMSFYPQNFLITSFLIIENCNKISTQQKWHRRRADKLSAAARRSIKVHGGGAHKLSAAARPAHGSSFMSC